MTNPKCCEHCDDGEGNCIYPYYGLAPHNHNINKTGSIIGSTEFIDSPDEADNFVETEDGAGVYAFCPYCHSC